METRPAIIESCGEGVRRLFRARSVRKALACAVAVVALTGGVAMCANHYQHTREEEAQSRLIMREAEKRNVAIIDEGRIPAIVADALGYPEDDIWFKELELKNRPLAKDARRMPPPPPRAKDGDQRPQPPQPPEAKDGDQARVRPHRGDMGFRPVYKVKCVAYKVKYKLRIDAVRGDVLLCEVDD